jgi:hypothetical protein
MTAGRAAGSGRLSPDCESFVTGEFTAGKDNTRARANHMGITQYAT